jgi:AbiU2
MTKTLRPDVKQLLNALMREVLLGNTHLSIANGLRDADPVVLDTAGVFFGLTFTAHLEAAQMYAAKLFDTHRDAETIHTLLRTAEQNTHLFTNRSPQDVRTAVRDAKRRVIGLDRIIKPLQARRNKVLAHLAPETVIDPVKLIRDAKLTLDDLLEIFNAAGEIVNEISRLYMDATHLTAFPSHDDYKHALKLVAEAKCAEIRKYEDEYKTPWTGARPKNCPPIEQV